MNDLVILPVYMYILKILREDLEENYPETYMNMSLREGDVYKIIDREMEQGPDRKNEEGFYEYDLILTHHDLLVFSDFAKQLLIERLEDLVKELVIRKDTENTEENIREYSKTIKFLKQNLQ